MQQIVDYLLRLPINIHLKVNIESIQGLMSYSSCYGIIISMRTVAWLGKADF